MLPQKMATTASQSENVRVTVTLPESLVRRLHETAHSRGIGVSTLIRMLLHASYEHKTSG